MLQQPTLVLALVAVYAQLLLCCVAARYCYDHQTETYDARFIPTYCTKSCTVTPFFSPDTSIKVYLHLIEEAKESIDVYTPYFKSWANCTDNDECGRKIECTGCPIQQQRNETFPVFPALLNAVHERGVKIRIITNNFSTPTCPGSVSPLDWLVLNNIQVRYYTTTTFVHTKYIAIDKGAKTAISSVNWSYTSFLKNREAGVILENCTCSAITFYQSVFEYDWDNGVEYVVNQTYSPSEMRIITNPAHMPYAMLKNHTIPGAFVTHLIPHPNVVIKQAYTAPDNARDTLMTLSFQNAKSSLQLAIYQVTDDGLCDELLGLFKRGMNVTMLICHHVIPPYNNKKAMECYKKLYCNGMRGRVQSAFKGFRFSHEKYWIVDGTTVHLSTGNWSPSDFPNGSSWEPHRQNINRDLLVVMESASVVAYFDKVFNADWTGGQEWTPSTACEDQAASQG